MAICKSDKYNGSECVLEYALVCGDQMPLESDWKRLGAMRTKDFNLEWETNDGTTDDSIGNLRENIASFQTASVSGDGVLKRKDAQPLVDLVKHVANPGGGQPNAWIRLTYPDLTFVFFAVVTNCSRSAPHDDLATYSFEATATSSEYGLIVGDTPDPDVPAVTSVDAYPTALTLDVGDVAQIVAIVSPVGAPSAVNFSSSATGVATVNSAGVVTAVGDGIATITVTSVANGSKTDTVSVTVNA